MRNLLFCFSSITVSFSVSPCRFDDDATNGTALRFVLRFALADGEVELPATSKQSPAVASRQTVVSDQRQMM